MTKSPQKRHLISLGRHPLGDRRTQSLANRRYHDHLCLCHHPRDLPPQILSRRNKTIKLSKNLIEIHHCLFRLICLK